jgi:CHAD domain-containing protein
VCTLALEARGGDPAYAWGLALELLDALPLHIGPPHPAERARALLFGESARPRKAAPVAVAPDATLEELVVAVIDGCLRQITGNVEAAALGVDPEGVHQLRVGVRRLRSALAFFAPVLPERQRAMLRETLRPLAGALGPARDLDVFAVEWLGPALRARPGDEALLRFDARVRGLRAEQAEHVRKALDSKQFPRLVFEIRRWMARRAWREQPLSAASAALFGPARDFAARRLESRHKKTRKALRTVDGATAEQRHELRIATKKLRYATEFTASLFPGKRARRYLRRLEALQDALGVANDATVAERLAGEIAAQHGGGSEALRAAGFLAGWAAHAAHERIETLPSLAKRFDAAGRFWPKPPKAPAQRSEPEENR